LHHDDDGRRDYGGRYRVHHNAELAVIRVGRARVLVDHLGYSQHRQKDKANHRDGRQKALPDAAFSVGKCLESLQPIVSVVLSILQSDAIYWTPQV
jgi:hypothetical protein